MGPFSSDTLSAPPGTREGKIWTSSHREGDGDALLMVTFPSGWRAQQIRAGGVAFVDNVASEGIKRRELSPPGNGCPAGEPASTAQVRLAVGGLLDDVERPLR